MMNKVAGVRDPVGAGSEGVEMAERMKGAGASAAGSADSSAGAGGATDGAGSSEGGDDFQLGSVTQVAPKRAPTRLDKAALMVQGVGGAGKMIKGTLSHLSHLVPGARRRSELKHQKEDEQAELMRQEVERETLRKAKQAAISSPGLHSGGTKSAKGKVMRSGRNQQMREAEQAREAERIRAHGERFPLEGGMRSGHDEWVEAVHDGSKQVWAALDVYTKSRLTEKYQHMIESTVEDLGHKAAGLQQRVADGVQDAMNDAVASASLCALDEDEVEDDFNYDEGALSATSTKAEHGSNAATHGNELIVVAGFLTLRPSVEDVGDRTGAAAGGGDVGADASPHFGSGAIGGLARNAPCNDLQLGSANNGPRKKRPTLMSAATELLASTKAPGNDQSKGARRHVRSRWHRLDCVLTVVEPLKPPSRAQSHALRAEGLRMNDTDKSSDVPSPPLPSTPSLRLSLRDADGRRVPLSEAMLNHHGHGASFVVRVADVPDATAIAQMRGRQNRLTINAERSYASSHNAHYSSQRAANALRKNVLEIELDVDPVEALRERNVERTLSEKFSLEHDGAVFNSDGVGVGARAGGGEGPPGAAADADSISRQRQRVRCCAESGQEKRRWLKALRESGVAVVEGEFESMGEPQTSWVRPGTGNSTDAPASRRESTKGRSDLPVATSRLPRWRTKELGKSEAEEVAAKKEAMDPELQEKLKTYKKKLYKVITGEQPEVSEETGEVMPRFDPELLELEGWLRVRRQLATLVLHPGCHFDQIVMVLICISTILLCVDSPLADPTSPLMTSLYWLDIVLTILFTAEMSIKIGAFTFCSGRYV
jgi:hypothetical protein